MAQQPEPTAPFHSVQHALRVLDAVTRRRDGITDAQLVRETWLPARELSPLLRMLRREGMWSRSPTARTSSASR
jgi:DNA-binding IclR family transcriptional regulator